MKSTAQRSPFEQAFGPASRATLGRAGISSLAEIVALGSVETYRRAKAANATASLNLLWAIEAAQSGRDWRVVAREDRLRLLLALEALAEKANAD